MVSEQRSQGQRGGELADRAGFKILGLWDGEDMGSNKPGTELL